MENKMETWSQRIDRYIAEGRTVSGGCGPSDAMKRLNRQVQAFSNDMIDEAHQVFGDTSQLFQSLKGSLDKIVRGGPDQQGWGAAESNAVTSQIMNQAAVNARNQKAAVGNALAAIGGGNVVTPAGLQTAVNLQTNQAVEEAKSQQLSQATVANYETGRQNYFEAVKGEMGLPGMFETAKGYNAQASEGLTQAQKSQEALDKASGWWKPLVMGGISAATSFLTGGISNLGAGESFGEGVKDFFSGGMRNLGGK